MLNKKQIEELVKSKKKTDIRLDIGCGANKASKEFIGMDVRPLPGVDIVHNLEKYPYPFEDNTFTLVHASHVLEHMNPASTDPKIVNLIDLLLKKKVITKKEVKDTIGEYEIFGNFMTFMDEIWRITKEGGQFHFVVPYAGSGGYWQDPTHINPISEATIFYFAPHHRSNLWTIYKPKPWKIDMNASQPNAFLEVILTKIQYEEK